MYHFNLLPVRHQKSTKRWIIVTHITNGMVFLNVVLVVVTALLFTASSVMANRVEEASAAAVEELRHSATSDRLVQDIGSLNLHVAGLAGIQRSHPNYLQLISVLSEMVEKEVSLSEMHINFEDERIRLSGTAADRSGLQNLKKNIENSKHFELVTFPFEEFTQSEQIPFSVELTFLAADFEY